MLLNVLLIADELCHTYKHMYIGMGKIRIILVVGYECVTSYDKSLHLSYYSLSPYWHSSACRKHAQDGLLGEMAKPLTDQEVLLLNAQLQLIGESAVASTGDLCTVAYRLVKGNDVSSRF